MSNVIPFRLPVPNEEVQEPEEQVAVGDAKCMSCKHEWEAVFEVGTVEYFECPECEDLKGRPMYTFAPNYPAYHCECGNNLFFVTQYGNMCQSCGIYIDFS